jgi:hypothetical protein
MGVWGAAPPAFCADLLHVRATLECADESGYGGRDLAGAMRSIFKITFEGARFEGRKRELVLEHQVSPSAPFRMRISTMWDAKTNDGWSLVPDAEDTIPPWAVRYAIRAPKERPEAPGRLEYEVVADPSVMIWMGDAVGFPIYADMKIAKLVVEVRFPPNCGPVRPRKFQRLIRRLKYAEVGQDADAVNAATVAARPDESYLVTVPLGEAKGDVPIPSGCVYGIEWDRLEQRSG